jgi:hypothetical protein
MKKILFTLLATAFTLTGQAQINGYFMGLKMGFSSMEDAIDIFESRGIEYEKEDNSTLAFFGHCQLEGLTATEGYMLFLNDQLTLLMVHAECNQYSQNCKNIKHALKNKYQDLEDDYSNLLLSELQQEDVITWAKTDGKLSVFYVYDDSEIAWGYITSTNQLINTILKTTSEMVNYLDLLEELY